jgi:hypothetical protein
LPAAGVLELVVEDVQMHLGHGLDPLVQRVLLVNVRPALEVVADLRVFDEHPIERKCRAPALSSSPEPH